MRNGPVKIILIQAGKYDYAEVVLEGAIQIVGGNNVGKTTLINTLPFLYVDDRSKMSFGRYSLDQTLEYYFRSQYSYVLFECRTLRGQAVVGWRGNSKQSDAGPERFCYLGPYRREDFFSETGRVREPRDVSATLALNELQLTPKPQQHREVILAGAGERGNGLGIVSLKDNDKFHHFRETLKNLLMLKDISQEQMRDSLLLLADIPTDHRIVAAQPYPLLFATISGAHLYGFPSPDSDFDLRGAHVLPLERVVGLEVRDETVQDSRVIEGLEMDIVSHDVGKFFKLLLKKNGYVLEQLFSPLVLQTRPEHAELKAICRAGNPSTSPNPLPGRGGEGVITKHHAHHYFGFAETEWKLFLKQSPRRVKPLLYVYRVLLIGIHLMRTGEVEANLVTLNESFRLPYIGELIERKTKGEKTVLDEADVAFHESEYQRL